MADLFSESKRTPAEASHAALERHATAMRERERRAVDRAARDRVWKLELIMNALGAKLARSPDDVALGKLFHTTCDRLHDAETALPQPPMDGPMRMTQPPEVPQWIADELVEIGQSFEQKESDPRQRVA